MLAVTALSDAFLSTSSELAICVLATYTACLIRCIIFRHVLRAAAGNPRTAAVMAALVPYDYMVI